MSTSKQLTGAGLRGQSLVKPHNLQWVRPVQD